MIGSYLGYRYRWEAWMVIKDHERFAHLASGFQSIVIAIAVVVGGVWTAWTFSTLKSAERARSELEKAKLELEVQSLRRPVLDLTITTEVLARVKNVKELFPPE